MAQTKIKTTGITDSSVSNAKLGTDISAAKLTAGTIDGDRLPSPTLTIKGDGSSNPAAIKLNCEQNSHGVTIKSPVHSSAANYTLTLPVNDGDADQFLKTDGSGVTSWAAAGGGKIGQVINTATTAVISTTSTSAVEISGLTAAITPAATSSKVLVLVYLSGGATSNAHTTWQLFRDTTQIALGDADGSRTRATFGYRDPGGDMAYTANPWNISWVDSPSSTSELIYSLKWTTSTGTIYLNRTFDNTDNANYQRTVSCITAMEILA
jgi:hypothetical protein